MGVAVAQFLAIVRGEIDNCDPAAWRGDARGFGQHGFGRVRIVQHLVEQHGIERGVAEGQRGKIALHQFDSSGRQMLEPRARNPQHFGALVDRDDVGGGGCVKLGHPPGAGADIEQAAQI